MTVGCVSQETYQAALDKNEALQHQVDVLHARLARQRAAYDQLLADLKPLIDKGLLQVEQRDGRVVIGMASDVLFASGSADLSDAGKANVAEVSRALQRLAKELHFQVEGHTDNQPIATERVPDNYWLGAGRAINVVEYMVAQGFPRDRISAATFGDSNPVASHGGDSYSPKRIAPKGVGGEALAVRDGRLLLRSESAPTE